MKLTSIAFIIPYFGKLPDTFEIWLKSCKYNPTIDWFLYTDDRRTFAYPKNVHVIYMEFKEFVDLLQGLYDFPIGIKSPKKLCDFKVAYGEIFQEQLRDYDFWGYCDLDIIWGNLRFFYTEKVLRLYDKIGFTGNCMIFRNHDTINKMYRQTNHRGEVLYKEYFLDDTMHCFDEVGVNDIFQYHKIPCYTKTNFSNLASMRPNFHMCFLPKKEWYKNKHVLYYWNHGELFHVYSFKNKVCFQKIMFLHFLGSRAMKVKIDGGEEKFLVVPNEIISDRPLDIKFLKQKTTGLWLKYLKKEIKEKKSLKEKIWWMEMLVLFHYWYLFHNDVFNYWVWTKYDKNKRDRIQVIEL